MNNSELKAAQAANIQQNHGGACDPEVHAPVAQAVGQARREGKFQGALFATEHILTEFRQLRPDLYGQGQRRADALDDLYFMLTNWRDDLYLRVPFKDRVVASPSLPKGA